MTKLCLIYVHELEMRTCQNKISHAFTLPVLSAGHWKLEFVNRGLRVQYKTIHLREKQFSSLDQVEISVLTGYQQHGCLIQS